MMNNIIKINNLGQGLLETIIALGVIITGIIALLTLAISNQTSSILTNDRFIAANLAREGIEVVHYMRDTNWMQREDIWDEGFDGDIDHTEISLFDPSTGQWSFSWIPDDFTDVSTYILRKAGIYYQSEDPATEIAGGAIQTNFQRLVTLDEICYDGSIKSIRLEGFTCENSGLEKIGVRVKSEVQWSTEESTHNIILEESLYNWRMAR